MAEKRSERGVNDDAAAGESDGLESAPAPRKVEGDALLSGTGSRHGVEKSDERPITDTERHPRRD